MRLSEAEMRPVLMVIVQIRRHQPFEMPLIQDDRGQANRVGNFPPSVQQHRSATDSERPCELAELRCASPSKLHRLQTLRRGRIARICAAARRPMLLAVVVQAKEHWGFASRQSAGSYAGHGPMTKKQYRAPNVSVGTVKKSIAAMASRWFLRNISQRFMGSGTLGVRRMHRETPRSEPSKPSLSNSP